MSGTTRTEDEYAALYQEHNARLVAYARSLTGNQAVAEDLAAEAHFRVWRRLSEGHAVDNPSAYLTTTVRNLAAGLGRARREIAGDLDEIPQDAERSETAAADPEQRASHVDLISRLLKELPERWAKALWYAEVEDLPMEAVGARIGASAGTTAVVLTRARERLRQAFLQSQSGAAADEACEPYWKQMPAIVRATASARRTKTVLEHCDECADCRARMLVLTEANTRLPVLLGPALLGIMLGGGAWFLPAVAGVGAAGAGAASSTGASGTAGTGAASGTGASGTAGAAGGASGTGGAAARTGSKARHAHISARAHALKHGLSPAKTAVYGSVAAVGVAAVVAAVALGSTTSPSHTPTASAQLTARPTVAAEQTAASAANGSAAGTPTAAATQAAALATPASADATSAPGTTSPASAANLTQGSQQENQAAATDPATSNAATTPAPASTTPSTTTSPTSAATVVMDSSSASASSAASPTTESPTPNPTPTPTLTPTATAPSSPTPPSCTFYIGWICVIG
jgi:RNA polymerase sigma factor (sigma-70 family)